MDYFLDGEGRKFIKIDGEYVELAESDQNLSIATIERAIERLKSLKDQVNSGALVVNDISVTDRVSEEDGKDLGQFDISFDYFSL